ncbi:MAG TPA: fused MFS/spermidine synthase [Blastocatellia bacterium]
MTGIKTFEERARLISGLFAVSLFTGAILLFWVQPLIAKALLPAYGGAPELWGGCILFFQSALVMAYGYVILLEKLFSLRRQVIIHIALLALAAVFALPLNLEVIRSDWLYNRSPILSVLAELAVTLGLPAFALATSSPLLQTWVAQISPGYGQSVYSLYAVSNAGSLIATVGYPFLMEPMLSLNLQAGAWAGMYAAYALAVLTCALLVWRLGGAATSKAPAAEPAAGIQSPGGERLRWILLSAVPASLLLSVTNYVTSNITAAPLLWLAPLTLYLLAFILAFATRSYRLKFKPELFAQGAAILLTLTIVAEATEPAWALALLHLAGFFILAAGATYRLASAKPPVKRLSEYYLMIAVGGWLGGAFNAFLAPRIFDRPWEYPLMIVVACLVCQRAEAARPAFRDALRDVFYATLIGALALALAGLAVFVRADDLTRVALAFGLPLALANHIFRSRPPRFTLAISAIVAAGAITSEAMNRTLYSERNFFGVLRVTSAPDFSMNSLMHGNTIHGKQFTDEARKCIPISYFHADGPFGDVVRAFEASQTPKNVGIIGLGVGAMAGYARPGQDWTFYELNPEVIKIARNDDYFTYLSDCAGQGVRIVPGDARLKLREALDQSFGLIVFDAFNSDAIPTHLLTMEAIELYLKKLGGNGLLVFHISNRSVDLRPVLASAADAVGAECLWRRDTNESPAQGKDASEWVVLVRRANSLEGLAHLLKWERITSTNRDAVWTDNYASLLKVIRWM